MSSSEKNAEIKRTRPKQKSSPMGCLVHKEKSEKGKEDFIPCNRLKLAKSGLFQVKRGYFWVLKIKISKQGEKKKGQI